MKVKARCTARCWDSRGEIFGYPFLCSPGEVYDIPMDGLLAKLTVHAVAYDQNGNAVRYHRDHEGKLTTVPIAKPDYIFEFDRNPVRTDAGEVVAKDYSCKEPKCVDFGKDFKTLANLGRHSNQKHRELNLIADDDAEVFADRTCGDCGKVCKSPYGLRVHKEKAHGINRVEATNEVIV